MSPHPDTLRHPLHPKFAIEIKTPAQAELARKILIVKIGVQILVIAMLLALAGLTLWQMAFVAAFACAWKGFDMWRAGRLNLFVWRKA